MYEYFSGNCVLFLEVFIILKHMLCYITLSEIQDSYKLGGGGFFFSLTAASYIMDYIKNVCCETLLCGCVRLT